MDKVFLIDSTLRDGNHSVKNNFNLSDIELVTKALDSAKVDFVEVGFGYGFGYMEKNGITDVMMLKTARKVLKNSKLAVLVFPDKCPLGDLKTLVDLDVDLVRIAVQSNNPNPAKEYVEFFKERKISVGGFLMMAHKVDAPTLLENVKTLISYGIDNVCVTDSSGFMGPDEVEEKIDILNKNIEIPIAFHTHDNLGLAVGNSLVAVKNGARYIDTSLGGIGAGAGNTPTETLVAALNKSGYETNADLFKTLDAFEILYPIANRYDIELKRREDTIMLGYTGVYSTFMNPAREVSEKYNVDYRVLLQEAANQKLVAGEEDKLVDIARSINNN